MINLNRVNSVLEEYQINEFETFVGRLILFPIVLEEYQINEFETNNPLRTHLSIVLEEYQINEFETVRLDF